VSREHVADAGDAAVFAAHHGEPLQREGRPGTVSQQVLETLKIARHVAVQERDPDARVDRKPTVLPGKHVDGRISVEEPLHAETTHDTTAHLLGERGQIRLGDRSSRQERWPPVTGWHEDAVGRAHMQVHVVIDRRSEAVQKRHGTESRASRARPVTVTGQARRSTEQPLDVGGPEAGSLVEPDPRQLRGDPAAWHPRAEASVGHVPGFTIAPPCRALASDAKITSNVLAASAKLVSGMSVLRSSESKNAWNCSW
jgi:hypothetical protein